MDELIEKFTTENLDAPVEREEVHVDADAEAEAKRRYDDEAALKILKQDMETGEADKTLLDFSHLWTVADQLLHGPWLNNYFYNPARANVPRYTLSNVLDVVTTKFHEAIFFEETPFMLMPSPKLSQKTIWAKEWVHGSQLRQMQFENEVEKGIFQCGHLGTMFFKYGWMDCEKKVPVYKRKAEPATISTPTGNRSIDTVESDEFELVWESKDEHRPWLKWRDLRYLIISPTWNEGDVRKAAWVCDTDYVTFDEIDALRGIEGYDIPSREELESLFFPPNDQEAPQGDTTETRIINMRAWLSHAQGREVNDSADPFARKIRLIERWDKNRVTVALQNYHGYLLIRNEAHDNGEVPFFSSTWRPIPSCGYGQGLGELVGPDQQIEKGVLCAYLDILSFVARPSYVRQKAINAPAQNVSVDLGSIISVEGPVSEAFKMLEQPRVDQSLIYAIESAKSSAAMTSGANEIAGQGGSVGGGRATGMRSGSGAQLVGQAQASRLDGPLERFLRQVFVPWLYKMDEMNARRLPTRTLREILGEDAEHDYSGMDHIEWRNAKVDYQVLAGSHLGPRKEMAQFMPFIMQMVNTPSFLQMMGQAGYMLEPDTFFQFWSNLAGIPNQKFFRKMTDEEKKQAQANSPAAIQQMKGQQAQQLQSQKDQAKQQQISDQAMGRAAGEVTRQVFEQAMTPLATEGEPGNKGFGDSSQ